MNLEGTHYKFRKLEFWAERGLINIVDERLPPEHHRFHMVISRREFLRRLQAFSDELRRRHFKYEDERNQYIRLLEEGVQVAREAKNQGEPTNPDAISEMVRRRRLTMLMSDKSSPILKLDGAALINPAGAIPALFAPENDLLPPIPRADPNKPITPFNPEWETRWKGA